MRDMISDHVARHGQHIVQVLLTVDDPDDALPFVYTIGNHERGLPELLIIGNADDDDMWTLNFLGDLQRNRGKHFQHDELVSLGGTLPVKLVDAGRVGREQYAVQVGVYYGTEDFGVMQVLICDPAGRYPDDPECEEVYRSQQPVLSLSKN
jgi:hypothetical protein